MKKYNLKKLLKFIPIIGIILFIYLIYDTGFENIVNVFLKIPIEYYFFACLLLIPRILISTYKWWYICKKQKIDIEFFNLMKIFLISLFYGNVTPGGLGWNIRIFYLKKKKNITIGKGITNSLIDLTLGFTGGLILSLIGSILIIDKIPYLFPIILGSLIFNITSFTILMQKRTGTKLVRYFIRPLIPNKYKSKIDKSVESLYKDIPRLRDSIIPIILEIFVWIIACSQVYILSLAFNLAIPFFIFILLTAISVIVTGIIPVSVGGLGVREGTFAFLLLTLYNVDQSIGFSLALAGYLVKMIFPAIAGILLQIKKENRLA